VTGPILETKDLHVSYGKLDVLTGVDVTVDPGEAVGLLGTNGAGKSTLLKAVCAMLPLKAGRILIDGDDVTGASPRAVLDRGIVQVPGGRATFPSLTVDETLRVAAWPFRKDRDRVEAGRRRVFDTFPILEERRSQLAGTLSGGQQQMLALARALVQRPRLLIIDELSLGLAPLVTAELVQIVQSIVGTGVAVLLVDQRLATAIELTDRAYFLERGCVRFDGPTAALAERGDLVRSVFLAGAAR
jgi:ABC-type branched-subunit amino acid transport system ATPase component